MKTFRTIAIAFGVAIALQLAGVSFAAPFPTGLGGTGTSTTPLAGQVPIGTNVGTYGPAYLLCTGNCSVATSSGAITINVPPQTTSTVQILPVAVAANSFSIVGDGTYVSVTNPGTSTIQVSLSTAKVLQLLSAASPLTYNSSTGAFSCPSCLTSLNGALLVANNLSDVASTSAARLNLGLGSIATFSKTDYLTSSTLYVSSVNASNGAVTITSSSLGVIGPSNFLASSTQYVSSLNGATGTVTITSSSLGVVQFATTTINGNPSLTFYIVGDGTTVTSTVSGATTTFSIITSGNWSGPWQGVSSSTFYLASNPKGYGTSNVSTSTANTWIASQTFALGTTSAQDFESTLYADQFSGSDMSAKINSAYASSSATGVGIGVSTNVWNDFTPIVIASSGVPASISCPPGTQLNFQASTGTALNFNVGNNLGILTGLGTWGCFYKAPFAPLGTTSTVGISILSPGVAVENSAVEHYNVGVTFGSNAYRDTLMNTNVFKNTQDLLWNGTSNSGENDNLIDDTIFDAYTATNCADNDSGNYMDINMFGVSFDNCQYAQNSTSGAAEDDTHMIGTHQENSDAIASSSFTPYPFVVNASSTVNNNFIGILDSQFLQDGSTIANTAPCYFDNRADLDLDDVSAAKLSAATTTANLLCDNYAFARTSIENLQVPSSTSAGVAYIVNGLGNPQDVQQANIVGATIENLTDWQGDYYANGNINASGTLSQSGVPVALDTTQINSGGILSGGGALSSNQTISLSTSTLQTQVAGLGFITSAPATATIGGVPAPFNFTIATTTTGTPSISTSTSGGSSTVAFTVPDTFTLTTTTLTYSAQIFATTTVTTITNTTSPTAVVSTTIPGNTLGNAGQVLRVQINGTYLNTSSTAQNLIAGVYFGGVEIAGNTTIAAITTSTTPQAFTETFQMSNASGTTNNQISNLVTMWGTTTGNRTGNLSTVDSTQPQSFQVKWNPSAASTLNTVTVNSVSIMLDGATTTVVTGMTYR